MERLSGFESYLLQADSAAAPGHVSALGIYDPAGRHIDFAAIQSYLAARVHRHGMFRRRLATLPLGLGRPFWVDEAQFDIEYHVRHIALPRPRDWTQLCTVVARLHARPLDLTRPLWECYVIEELDNVPGQAAGSFAVLIKVHNAALGGELETELLAALHELSAGSQASAPKERPYFDAAPAVLGLALRNAMAAAALPLELGRYLLAHVAPVLHAGGARAKALAAPACRLNRRLSSHRMVGGATFARAALEALCARAGAGDVHDVVLSLIGGALRRHLRAHMDLPDTSLLAEVALRSAQGPGRRGRANSAGLALHTGVSDPLERLRRISAGTHAARGNARSYLGRRLALDALEFVPTVLLGVAGKALQASVNTSVARVQGPQAPLYFAGSRLAHLFTLPPLRGAVGLAHTVTYYCDEVTIGVSACRNVLPDTARYAAFLNQEFDELLGAA
ncbi:MAG: wax ester/triacylglycerol synthase domain-containing protein [Pseudomonadota bacterium]